MKNNDVNKEDMEYAAKKAYSKKLKLKGFGLASLAVIVYSPDSLFLRLPQNVEVLDLLFFRYFFSSLAVLLYFVALIGWKEILNKVRQFERWDLIAVVSMAVQCLCYATAVRFAGAANSLVISCITPMITCILSYFIDGERPRLITLLAMTITFISVVYIFCVEIKVMSDLETNESINESDLNNENDEDNIILGNFLALLAAFTWSLYLAIARKKHGVNKNKRKSKIAASQSIAEKDVDSANEIDPVMYNIFTGPLIMLSSIVFGASFSSIAGGFFSLNFLYIFVGGFIFSSLGDVLLTYATKYVDAPVASLFSLLEVIFGPLLVYIVLGEEPRTHIIIGGSIMVVTLFGHNLFLLRPTRCYTVAPVEQEVKIESEDLLESCEEYKSVNTDKSKRSFKTLILKDYLQNMLAMRASISPTVNELNNICKISM